MDKREQQKAEDRKLQWTTPELVDVDSGLGNIKLGFNAGTDGAGGFTTSSS